jgi:hypothetical protein
MVNTKTIAMACAAALSSACDDGGSTPPEDEDDGDPMQLDAGVDASLPGDDGGSAPDAATGMGFGLECRIRPEDHFTAEAHLPGGMPFAMQVDKNRLHLAYVVPTCVRVEDGKPNDVYGTALRYVSFDSSGEIPEPSTVVDSGAECKAPQYPALAASDDDVNIYYVDRLGRRLEVLKTTAQGGEPVSFMSSEDREGNLAAFWHNTSPLVAWTSGVTTFESVWAAHDDGAAVARELVPTDMQHQPSHIAATALPGSGGLLAWVSKGAVLGIFTQPLSAGGVPVGSPQRVSDDIDGASSVDVAVREDDLGSGALAYNTGSEQVYNLRLRTFDADGALTGSEHSIASGDVRDPGIAPYSVGYVIAYRVGENSGRDTPVIRVAFVDALGNLAGTRDVAPASSTGSPVRIHQALDGRMFVVWVDASPQGTTLHAVRTVCE